MHDPSPVPRSPRPNWPLRLLAIAAAAGCAMPALAQVNPLQPNAPQPARPSPDAPKPPPPAQTPTPSQDGPSYPVTSFIIRYATEHPDRPSIEDLLQIDVELGQANGVFVAPRPGADTVTLKLEDLTTSQRSPRPFSVSALNAIGQAIVKELNRRGIIGVMVAPDPNEVNPNTLEDLRAPGVQTMTLDVWTRAVQQIRTLGSGPRWSRPTASGDRPSEANRINHRFHERIRDNSPLQPGPEGQPGDLLRKDALDDYLYRLNRQPGRRVDVAVSSAETPGDVVLDYIVTENRPWTVYFQVSNTGTKDTNEWRERLGFVHDQLTNRDDILSIDYITAGFDDANAVVASYDAPFGSSQVLRWKVYGDASNFTASDVGVSNERFKGDSVGVGGELTLNIFQRRQSFVDAFAGVRWQREHVKNEAVDVSGRTDFFLPYAGLRFERDTGKSAFRADTRFETNIGSVGTDPIEAQKLGRLFVDKDWTTFKWDLEASFYLEPLIFGAAWSDPSSPYRKTTLAHEIALSFRGQEAFNHRLIPQEEALVGGLYTVRGYPESLVAGDNAIIFSAEYRFHLPRVLAIQEDPSKTPLFGRPFRFAPDQRYGRPDWDLIFRGFLDVGRATNSDRQSFEKDETLVGTGFGVELLFKRNLSLRLDWGFALEDAADVKAGDNRLHFVGTILY
jgi:hemolysin activation/secretion protein